jgi:hypothetical protein
MENSGSEWVDGNLVEIYTAMQTEKEEKDYDSIEVGMATVSELIESQALWWGN